jgi:hypothetical protein
MLRGVRLGLLRIGIVLAAAGASLAFAFPAAAQAEDCGGWVSVGSHDQMDACFQFGYAGDPSRVAVYSNIDEDWWWSGQNVYEQECLWTNNNSSRVGCSSYQWKSPGDVLMYSPPADIRKGNWVWNRLWVSGTLVTTYKDYFS